MASAELLAKLAGRRVVASISGGKDSAALSLWLHEQGIEHDRVFLDTGWEHPATYEYLRGELTRVIGPITEVRGPETMEELVLRKGMFPSRLRRFCTQELKVFPMQRYLAALTECAQCGVPGYPEDQGDECECGGDFVHADVVQAVGIRHEESASRATMPEWEWSEGFDCETWRPLIQWTEAEVILIHKRHGLAPNPLYLKGASRVGCWPCIYARKAEVRLVADLDPERIEKIRALEADLSARAGAPRAWFQARTGRVGIWPIEKVAEWSRTAHGGRQFELFAADPQDAGCMRWGLCETSTPSTKKGPALREQDEASKHPPEKEGAAP